MRLTILAGGLLLALSSSIMAGQVYKWVDAKGVTHFGAQPPQGMAAETLNTPRQSQPWPKATHRNTQASPNSATLTAR